MSNNNGKVILSLLAGATAGIVTGLLLAPETGEETRNSVKKSAGKLGEGFGKFFQDALAKVGGAGQDVPNAEAGVSEDRAAADSLFNSMNDNQGASQPAGRPASQSGDNATTTGL